MAEFSVVVAAGECKRICLDVRLEPIAGVQSAVVEDSAGQNLGRITSSSCMLLTVADTYTIIASDGCGVLGVLEEVVACPPAELGEEPTNPVYVSVVNAQPDVEKFTYCNPATETWWVKVCTYRLSDPEDSSSPLVESVLSDSDTGISCDQPLDDVEVVTNETCNTDTGTTWLRVVQYVYENGVRTEQVIEDWADTGIPCVAAEKDTDILVDCVGTTQTEQVDQRVSVVGSENILNVRIVEDCTSSTDYDFEYVCNDDTNLQELHVFTTIDEVLNPVPQVIATGIACDVAEDTLEAVAYCNVATGTTWIRSFERLEDGTVNTLADENTGVACTEPQVQVEVITECNADTGFWDRTVIVFSDGVEVSSDTTPTTIECAVATPDYEVLLECRNGTEHRVIYEIIDGASTEIQAVDTTIVCEQDLLQDILDKLNESCEGNPQNVKVCPDPLPVETPLQCSAGTIPAGNVTEYIINGVSYATAEDAEAAHADCNLQITPPTLQDGSWSSGPCLSAIVDLTVVTSGGSQDLTAHTFEPDCASNTTTASGNPLTDDCNGELSSKVHDACVLDAINTNTQAIADLQTALVGEHDETQALLQGLQDILNAGIDVNATLVGIDPTVEAQLQALIQAALEAVEPLQVELAGNSQNVLQAALQWAADNLQFDVLATQDGTWTVDLSAATIAAIEDAFDNALANATIDVNVTNNPLTVALDAASLSALENITVTIDGQPIDVNVVGSVPVDISAQSITDLATALDGLNVNATISGTVDVNVDSLSTAALADLQAAVEAALGNVTVDVNITNGQLSVSLDAIDPAVLTQLQGIFEAALGNVVVDITGTVDISAQSIADLATALDGLNVNATIVGDVSIDPASVTAIAQAIAGETLTVDIANQPIQITGTVDLGDVSTLTNWLAANELNVDNQDVVDAINAITFTDLDDTDDDRRPVAPQCYIDTATDTEVFGYFTTNETGGDPQFTAVAGYTACPIEPQPTLFIREICATVYADDGNGGVVGELRLLQGVYQATDTSTTLLRAETLDGTVLTEGTADGQYEIATTCDCDTVKA